MNEFIGAHELLVGIVIEGAASILWVTLAYSWIKSLLEF